MKIFGECEDRTLEHQIGSRTSKPLGHAAISYEAGFQAIYSQHWMVIAKNMVTRLPCHSLLDLSQLGTATPRTIN